MQSTVNPYFGLNYRYGLLLLATLFLGACGGGNSSPTTQTYTVNVTVAGLAGTGLVLQNNGGDDLVITADGIHSFTTAIIDGADYEITVLIEPIGPSQTCTVANANGQIASVDVNNILIACSVDSFSLGGRVVGLNGSGLELIENSSGDTLAINADGGFVFADTYPDDSSYSVTVSTQPASPEQVCTVIDGTGIFSGGDISGIAIRCENTTAPVAAALPTLTIETIKTFRFTWTDVVDATHYKLLEDPNGVSGFTQTGSNIPQGSGQIEHIVPLYARVNARYILQSCNAIGCTDAVPVLVNGMLEEGVGYFKASNAESFDGFGLAVALSGDGRTLAVATEDEDSAATGIDGDETDNSASRAGAVYVFTRSAAGIWSQQAYIKASNAEASDYFGFSLSLSADGYTLAVGAKGEESATTGINGDETDNSATSAGAVYVFTRGAAGIWSQQAYIKASNAEASDQFGSSLSLSLDGYTLAVGARSEDSAATGIDGDQTDNSTASAGAAYVFTRSAAGVWSQQAYIKASNAGVSDRFGSSLSLSYDGRTLAVGAEHEYSAAIGIDGDQSDNSAIESGAVYIFTRSAAGIWSQQAYIKASNAETEDFFGVTVRLNANGHTLAVGARGEQSSATGIDGDETDNSASNAGAVYVFTRDATNTWFQQVYIKASNAEEFDDFGASLSLSPDGRTLAVGASGEDSAFTGINGDETDNSASSAGAVYVFTRDAVGTWSQQAYIKASNAEAYDYFGAAVSLSANILAVGADGENSGVTGVGGNQSNNNSSGAGAVYLY